MAFNEKDSEYFGGAVLADKSCGSLTLHDRTGAGLRVYLDHDPEFTMSGLYEPSGAFDGYGY